MPPPSSAAARRATCSRRAPRWWPPPTPAVRSRSPPTPSGWAAACRWYTRWSCFRSRSREDEMAADGVEVQQPPEERLNEVLAEDALEFVAELHRRFAGRRRDLLQRRRERQRELDQGGTLDFLAETREVREGDWQVAPAPPDLQRRWVEITGPTDRKMVINALNSGATGFMTDFEDSNSPTWGNMIRGQQNLTDAIERTISLEQGEKSYSLNEEVATLLVRPRGWHLSERHVLVDGERMSASLFDF